MSKIFQTLTLNLKTDKTSVQYRDLEGRKYAVVPCVILKEQVLNGSGGAIFYPSDETKRNPKGWNHKPVVVYHPQMNGQAVSAELPEVIDSQKIGMMLNTRWDEQTQQLHTESWIDLERAKKVDNRVVEAIEKEEMLELSTGLYVDLEAQEGVWNEVQYQSVARNYNPDHLAILPDKKGACSCNDGCGFLRNEDGSSEYCKYSNWWYLKIKGNGLRPVGIDNENSFNNIQSLLYRTVRDKFGEDSWLEDVYPDFFIYADGSKLWKLTYSVQDGKAVLGDEEPVEVQRVTEYRTMSGSFVGNETMAKKELVDKLLKGSKVFNEDDRKYLEGLPDSRLEELTKTLEAPVVPQQGEEAPANNAAGGTPQQQQQNCGGGQQQPATQPAKRPTVQEYIDNAPPEIATILNNGLQSYAAEQNRLVQTILANDQNNFTEAWLKTQPTEVLRNMAQLASRNQQDAMGTGPYIGAAIPISNSQQATDPGVPLDLPVMNWSDEE